MREQVLLETLEDVMKQVPRPAEIIVVDQSPSHEMPTEERLSELDRSGAIRWVRLSVPSIPGSMNHGIRIATQPVVLFLDDDLTMPSNTVDCHAAAHCQFPQAKAVAGQVLQPGETPKAMAVTCRRTGMHADLEFPFFSSAGDWVSNVMAGNLSVNRDFALQIGGFDENFSGVAYRFETEFARRVLSRGGKIRFCPEASINHLRATRGGTRSSGSHLTSADPKHGVGDYYFAFLQGSGWEAWKYSLCRMFREVRTKFHLTHPWWIPVKLLGEIRAVLQAKKLRRRGQVLIENQLGKS